MSLYEELKGWQAGLGASLGFMALMAAAWWNFHLNRRRDAALRAQETISVAAALYGEIVLLRQETARLARVVAAVHMNSDRGIDKHFVDAHTPSKPILYEALASKIGLLSADLVIAITEFHKNFQETRTWLPLLIENSERGYSYSPLVLLVPARDAVQNIAAAMRKIERMASISKAEDPELGMTETIIEMEEDKFSRAKSFN